MNQHEAKERMRACRDQLKLALFHAEAMVTTESVTADRMTTLWQLTGKSHSCINALKSEISGNPPPKIG
jgi:hypothetical protein